MSEQTGYKPSNIIESDELSTQQSRERLEREQSQELSGLVTTVIGAIDRIQTDEITKEKFPATWEGRWAVSRGNCKEFNVDRKDSIVHILQDIQLRATSVFDNAVIVGPHLGGHHLAVGEVKTGEGTKYLLVDASLPQHHSDDIGFVALGNAGEIRTAAQLLYGGEWEQITDEYIQQHLAGEAGTISYGGTLGTIPDNYIVNDMRGVDLTTIDKDKAMLEVARRMAVEMTKVSAGLNSYSKAQLPYINALLDAGIVGKNDSGNLKIIDEKRLHEPIQTIIATI